MAVRRKRRLVVALVSILLATIILVYHHQSDPSYGLGSRGHLTSDSELRHAQEGHDVKRESDHVSHVEAALSNVQADQNDMPVITTQADVVSTKSITVPHGVNPHAKHVDAVAQHHDSDVHRVNQVERTPLSVTNFARVKKGTPCWIPGFMCRYYDGPADSLQCCCINFNTNGGRNATNTTQDPQATTLRCLPNFAVIGAQKSGSTALFGNFLVHPNFSAPSKKECHFFDKVHMKMFQPELARKNAQVRKYMETFPLKTYANLSTTLTGDATPAYILNTAAPELMAKVLPHIKLLLIVRDPVDRAYSEWQMKHRRVAAQMMLADKEEIHELASIFEACWTLLTSDKIKSFRKCPAITDLSKSKNVKLNWMSSHARRLLSPLIKCFSSAKKDVEHNIIGVSAYEILTRCIPDEDAIDARKNISSSKHDDFRLERLEHRRHSEIKSEPINYETIGDFPDIARTEIKRIRQECMESIGEEVVSSPKNDSIDHPLSFQFNFRRCWPSGSNSNIAKDFVVRGLYLEQIKRYNEFFASDQLMILHDTELKHATSATMDRVFAFVGLPPLPPNTNRTSLFNSSSLGTLIEETWPNFEANTGWHLKSKYPPMADDVRNELVEFYEPHNKRLEAYLNHSFGWSSLRV
eukprot:m.188686 g.188686  ORF g.188686 m.188686 type:complete len:638 (-) comp32353_c0_seq1:57-1970(-)